jgi:amidohydrolase
MASISFADHLSDQRGNRMLARAQAIADQIVGWRRHVHQYPELAFQEHETARFVAETLTEMGIPVQTGVAKTGVVARIGSGSPCIALRADMDALPVQEATGLTFASRHPGRMHACGHDAHIACLLGAARLLFETPLPDGEVRLLFQPSEEHPDEEGMSGAPRMLQAGVLEGVDAVFGLHVWFNVPAGKVALSPGPQMASHGFFEARIQGKGGHGAIPDQTIDPIVLAAQVVLSLQTIVSRRLRPTDAGVVTVGTIHGGTQDNIIPECVDISGTLRALNDGVYGQLQDEVRRVLGMVRPLGGDFEVRFSGGMPVVVNDPQMAALTREVAADLLGPDAVLPADPMMTGEDFSFFARQVPGCFMRLGGAFPGQPLRNHHDPHFDIDERALPIGAAIMAEVALRYIATRGGVPSRPRPERR